MSTAHDVSTALDRAEYAQYQRRIGHTLLGDDERDMWCLAVLADEIARLNDNLVHCEEALRDARSMNYETECGKLVGENKRLRKALQKFGSHEPHCRTRAWVPGDHVPDDFNCDCGLRDAIVKGV